MKRKRPIINSFLILILILLLGWGGHSWLQPKFPATVKGDDIVPAPRELEIPALSRQVYSNAAVKDVTRLNLFRKQRKKYYRPKPPKPKPKIIPAPPKVAVLPPPRPKPVVPPKPTVPPPKLILTGVLLFDGQQVAIFEGTYSEIRGGKLVQNLKPRRRGYKTGESLGGYEIKTIDKYRATLSATTGNHLTLIISKTHPNQKIQKAGNRLTQKSKRVSNKTAKTTSTSRASRARRTPIQKKRLNRIPPRVGSPRANQPPALSTPGTESSNPSNPRRPQRLKGRSMEF